MAARGASAAPPDGRFSAILVPLQWPPAGTPGTASTHNASIMPSNLADLAGVVAKATGALKT
jgi:hypothetical protein